MIYMTYFHAENLLLHLPVAGCNEAITSVRRRSNAFKSTALVKKRLNQYKHTLIIRQAVRQSKFNNNVCIRVLREKRQLVPGMTANRDYIKNRRIMQLNAGISCLAQITQTKFYTQNIHRHTLLSFSFP